MNKSKYAEIETERRHNEGFWTRKRTISAAVVSGVVIALVILAIVLVSEHRKRLDPDTPRLPLADAVSVDRVMSHLRSLNNIANEHNGTRAMNTTGYDASIQYVYSQLKEHTDYEVFFQDFYVPGSKTITDPTLSQTHPIATEYKFNVHFGLLNWFVGKFDFTANVSVVASFGCSQDDYVHFTADNIALVRRGLCTNGDKLKQAKNHGAAAIIIFNEGNVAERTGVFIGSIAGVTDIPVFSMANNVGEVLSVLDGVQLHLTSHNEAINFFTQNLVAETKEGSAESVIVVGAHLDSVIAGPGINDDGSGTSANLELALQIKETRLTSDLVSKVRFVWFAGEEYGLLGSKHYVSDLVNRSDETLKHIKANLNFDMLGSPNFMRGVYNGTSGNAEVRNGSSVIQSLFEEYFKEKNLAYQLTPFNGRSDYGPFIEVGIPAGGLFTGAEEIKTDEGRTLYGGFSNSAYDPCYHLACDTVDNINVVVLSEMTKNAAFVLEKLATHQNLVQFLNPVHH